MFTVREMYSGQYSLLHANLESQDAHSLPLFYFESASPVLKKKSQVIYTRIQILPLCFSNCYVNLAEYSSITLFF